MHFLQSALTTLVATATLATAGGSASDSSINNALVSCTGTLANNDPLVNFLAEAYAQVIGNYSESLAEAFIADDFVDTSDSINFLAGNALGSATFPSKQAFMAAQSALPTVPMTITSARALAADENCADDAIVVIWEQEFPTPVRGISVLVFECQENWWKLKSIDTEFNSATYVIDIGGTCTAPSRS